jgi:3-hydroxyisobutyrate dehydrogenase-like beta-hydroxyacid dehydrogenase
MKIGLIGTGIMGSRMARNLLKAGHEVTVHNRTRANAEWVLEAGAVWADSAAAVAESAEVVMTVLPQPTVVEQIAHGLEGLLTAMDDGAIWVDCTTGTPMAARANAAAAAATGVRFVEAPVGGTKGPAEEGTLVVFAGGDAETVAACAPVFDVIGSRTIHVGEIGSATSLKLVVNYMLATTMAAFGEAVALGEGLGLAREQLLNALVGSPIAPPFLGGKREKIAANEYSDTEFPLKWMQKDLAMVAATAYEADVAMPLANVTKEIYQLAKRDGLSDADFSAVLGYLTK